MIEAELWKLTRKGSLEVLEGLVDGFKRKRSSMQANLSCSLLDFAVCTELLATGIASKGLQDS